MGLVFYGLSVSGFSGFQILANLVVYYRWVLLRSLAQFTKHITSQCKAKTSLFYHCSNGFLLNYAMVFSVFFNAPLATLILHGFIRLILFFIVLVREKKLHVVLPKKPIKNKIKPAAKP